MITQHEILEAAKEAGLYIDGANQSIPLYVAKIDELERFAAIIGRIVERKTIKKCAVEVLAALKSNTREMEGYSYFGSNPGVCEYDYEDIAAAIRKLGE